MSFDKWLSERSAILNELEILGRLSEENIILEADTTQGAFGAVNQMSSVLQSSLSEVETQTETSMTDLKNKIQHSENPALDIKNYIQQKKSQLNKIKEDNLKNSNWLNNQDNYVSKGLSFLVKSLVNIFKQLLSPILKRLQKAFWEGVSSITPNANLVSIITNAIALTLFTSIGSIFVTFFTGGTIMAPIASLGIFLYFKAVNAFMSSLVGA